MMRDLGEQMAALNANSMSISQATGFEKRLSPEQAINLVVTNIEEKLTKATFVKFDDIELIDRTKEVRLTYFSYYEQIVREIFNERDIIIVEKVKDQFGNEVEQVMDREAAIFLCTSYTKPGLGPLEPLIRRPDVYTDIHVIAWNRILYERRGTNKTFKYKYTFISPDWYEKFCTRLATLAGKEINKGLSPYIDFDLYKDRYSMCSPAICTRGYTFTVRIHPEKRILFPQIIEQEILTWEIADEMGYALNARRSIFTAGVTGSGKTTLFEAFMNYYLKGSTDKVMLCEDTAELNLEDLFNVVPLVSENTSIKQDKDGVKMSLKDLITKVSLRQKPKHIVVGEGRGVELVDYIEAIETGNAAHSTGHGGTVKNVVNRICEKFTSVVPNMTIPQIEKKLGQAHLLMPLIHDVDGIGRKLLEYTELMWDEENERLIYNTIWKYYPRQNTWKRIGKYSEEFLFLLSRNMPEIYYDDKKLLSWFDLSEEMRKEIEENKAEIVTELKKQLEEDEFEGKEDW